MDTVFFIDVTTCFVEYCVTHSLNDFEENTIYNGKLAIKSNLSPEIVGNYYYKNNEFKQLPTKPSQYHIWNLQTEQWEEPEGYLQTIRADGNKQINQLASQKILSKYPIYKQLNIGRTSEAQVMYDWIDNIRNLSDIATASIETSTTLEQINSIVDDFKTELGNIA